MPRVYRSDYAGPARRVTTTPQGGMCVEAAVARTGVLDYSDGTRTWREYRSPREVFDATSLATLRDAPVTDLHPAAMVDPGTYVGVTRGHATGAPRRDGDLLVCDLLVQDAALMALVADGTRREVSCGYTCEVVQGAGVSPEGEHYDAVQTAIRHNHVALLAPGAGRAGPEVALRMDGAAVEVRRAAAEKRMLIKIRGREYKLDADAAPAQAAVDEVVKKADMDGAELEAVRAALVTLTSAFAALEALHAAPVAVTEEAVPEAVQDSIIAHRGALVATARRVLGPVVTLDGLAAGAIRRLVVAHALPAVHLDGLSADRLDGMYVAVTATTRNDGLARAHTAAAGQTGRTDGTDDPAADMRAATTARGRASLNGASR